MVRGVSGPSDRAGDIASRRFGRCASRGRIACAAADQHTAHSKRPPTSNRNFKCAIGIYNRGEAVRQVSDKDTTQRLVHKGPAGPAQQSALTMYIASAFLCSLSTLPFAIVFDPAPARCRSCTRPAFARWRCPARVRPWAPSSRHGRRRGARATPHLRLQRPCQLQPTAPVLQHRQPRERLRRCARLPAARGRARSFRRACPAPAQPPSGRASRCASCWRCSRGLPQHLLRMGERRRRGLLPRASPAPSAPGEPAKAARAARRPPRRR